MEGNGRTLRLWQGSSYRFKQFLIQEAGGLAGGSTHTSCCQPGRVPSCMAVGQVAGFLQVQGCTPLWRLTIRFSRNNLASERCSEASDPEHDCGEIRQDSCTGSLRWGLQMRFHRSMPEGLLAKFSEIPQARLIRGTTFVHETYGVFRSLDELWDGEI